MENSLWLLDPFLKKCCISGRIVGRIRKSDLNPKNVHPIILPKKSKIMVLVVKWSHSNTVHC